jgi:Domain of Unknown Function (DUF1206)
MVSTTQQLIREVATGANPIIDRIARLGFVANGVVVLIVGALALRFVLGFGQGVAGPEEALASLPRQPFGRITLAIVSLGLWAYAFWKLVQAIVDPEHKGTGFVGVMERVGFGFTALAYITLGIAGLQLLLGDQVGGTGDPEELAARILEPHFGRWVVGLFGGIILLAGALQVRMGVTARFRHTLALDRMSRTEAMVVLALGCTGYLALGIVSSVIGYFLIRVALLYNPEAAGGWQEALALLGGLDPDRWVLGAVAAGVVSYGLFFVMLVRYRRTY